MGARVFGPNEEDVGEISELVLDANGAPAKVIVDVGGFLGMGEEPVAIDLTALQIRQQSESGPLRAYIKMTQDELETLPATKMQSQTVRKRKGPRIAGLFLWLLSEARIKRVGIQDPARCS